MDLLHQFQRFIAEKNLFSKKHRLLLAVSGGLDSVVLCALCHQSGFDFVIAHCNFRLRGEESERDEKFVLALGKKYGREVLIKHFDTEKYAEDKKVSIQVAARELRYAWFGELVDSSQLTDDSLDNRQRSSVNYILTAHHLDDNIETLLMHFFRGTGIAGLRAMTPSQGKIIRPLLFAKKEALKFFADTHQLDWVEDSSNESDKYSRNYFRHQLIPLVQKIYPEVMTNLADNIDRFRDIEMLYDQSIRQYKKQLLEKKGNEIHIPVLKLKKLQSLKTICYEVIKEYGFTSSQVPELIALMDSDSGKYILSSTHRIIKNRNWLIIAPAQNETSQTVLIETGERNISFPAGKLQLEMLTGKNYKLRTTAAIAQLDSNQIKFPLLLRKWKQGDYFYPLGMPKKKKLARFLIDEKLSKTAKEKTWVIEMNKKIIWVVGLRIDDRFKTTPQTENILHITASSL